MIEGIRRFVAEEPWRTVSIVLGVVFVATVFAILTGGGVSDGDLPIAGSTTTITEVLPGGVSPTSAPAGEEPGAPTGGPGSGLVSVKIDNAPGARPQVGLAGLPVLIEYPVEGGVTRFVAVVGPDAGGEIGPVRSLRPVDADLLVGFAPFVVSSGGQPFVLQAVSATGLAMLDTTAPTLFVAGDREVVHNLFLLLDEISPIVSGAAQIGEGLPGGEVPDGPQATEIQLPFEATSYRFESGEYVRYSGSEPFAVLDSIGGSPTQLAHDIVVILFVGERSAGYVDGNGVAVSTFDVIGSGDLLVFQNGQVVEGTWLRGALEDGYRFFDSSGAGFGLPEGRTYLALVPRDQSVGY